MGQQTKETAHSIVLRECQHASRLEAGTGDMESHRLAHEQMLIDAGFTTFGTMIQRFSNVAEHGYTFVGVLGQSAANVHNYSERRAVSVVLVTCPDEDDDGSRTRKYAKLLQNYYGAAVMESKVICDIPL